MKRVLALALLTSLTSCYQNSLQGGAEKAANQLFNRPSVPSAVAQWKLTPTGMGYSLETIINGRPFFVEHGGEYMAGKRVNVNTPGVLPGAISAFEIDQPDGEGLLYYVMPKGGNRYVVYSRFYDPLNGRRLDAPKAVRTINL